MENSDKTTPTSDSDEQNTELCHLYEYDSDRSTPPLVIDEDYCSESDDEVMVPIDVGGDARKLLFKFNILQVLH